MITVDDHAREDDRLMKKEESHTRTAKSIFSANAGWKTSKGVRFLLYFILSLLMYLALFSKMVPQTYNIRLGQVSEKTIYAPRQIENAVETEKAKEEAAKKQGPVYKYVNLKNDTVVDAIYDKILQINADNEVNFDEKVSMYRSVIPQIITNMQESTIKGVRDKDNDELIQEMTAKVNDQQYRIPEDVYYKIPRLSKEDISSMLPITRDIVSRLMSDQVTEAQSARAKVAELVNSSELTKNTQRELVAEFARAVITPNKFFDQKATDEAKAQAREKVEPVYIKKDDVLVSEGEVVSEEIYQRLKNLDMLSEKANYWPHFGLAVFVAFLSSMLYLYIRQGNLTLKSNNSPLLMLVIIYTLNLIGMKVIALGQNLEYPYIGFLTPVAVGSMLIAILVNYSLAMFSTVIFSILMSIIFNAERLQLMDYRYGIVALVVGFTAVFAIHKASHRGTILRAGILTSLLSCLMIFSVLAMEDHLTRKDLMFSLSFGVSGGILSAVFVIGLLPFLEGAFGILSPLKLVELSNPNHPLLRKLLTETPGTYHHSIMVGNLAEAAAESIGADGLLCRVGSYYHDIGKTKRPSYFIENQNNMENPHDKIDPALSKTIITAHPRDGVEMLKEYNIPKAIRDIAEQHHGTTLLAYFYHKARKQAEEEGLEIKEEDFRYEGPKAQSKEAAVVGVADCVEAAVRSLRNPTIEQIDSMVRKIIKSRLDDGQFNECDLTLKELDTIAKTLNETLLGIFHSRIEYPSDDKPQSSDAGEAKA
ncbi:membrane-associated hydrolase-like protein [Paenibacillus larvae subsp. larvae]|uniref:Membrane-associated hydrolase-like protein n=4 Tax=Paenibacillus larvae TaxID=1464 RepID=V9W9E8_9BACL|nr:membrane-associated hydrolase-like protein [Paenibacillus larvae subsp. larvae DSM 25430]AVF21623.1 membrane-associated hydrolase-like protein [Paenibacillus larvae subsp. larvae]ETK27684.1 membrane-associated hydrolase-like protein [Paenibacillus larvae subsp. larvae DSM 25719]AVF27303.1 membrane-associated hydrolase-like protein [Paenibacillus larvae subsp. larvae]AVF31966.1 membrane-associated hydrolase-like protein [Paenibacillus larvae subsp. larvae]